MRFIVADDLTGACEAALAYAKRGRPALVWLDARTQPTPEAIAELGDASQIDRARSPLFSVVIDLDTRDDSPRKTFEKTKHVLGQLRPTSASEFVTKIDSTLRGNLNATVSAIRTFFPDAIALIAPSLPAQGRTMRDGIVSVRGMPIAPNVASRFDRASGHLSLATIRAGGKAIAAGLATLHVRGERIAIVDAETDDDLHALVAGARDRSDILWVGSGGLIDALAAAEPTASATVRLGTLATPTTHRTLLLIGSANDVTRGQIASFANVGSTETLDPLGLLRDDDATRAAIARSAIALADTDVALVALGTEPHVDHPRLRAAFITACTPLVTEAASLAIVLCGGAIARAFCDAFGIRGLVPIDEIVPGIPRFRALGTPLVLITKAGGFGRPGALRDVCRTLGGRTSA